MKTLLLALLFCQVVVKIYSLSRFEDVTAVKLTELKREWKEVEESNSKFAAKLTELFDEADSGEEKGSGGKPTPDPERKQELKALSEIVDALRKHIVPAVVKASKRRDEETEEYAGELVEMLKGEADKQELKQTLGKTVIKMHAKCHKIQADFLKLANESGLLKNLKEKRGSDKKNEVKTIKELLGSVEENDDFEALEKMGSGAKSVNQALKAFITINKLLSEATCGNPANELVDLIEKRITEEDPSDPFPDLQDRIVSLLGLDDAKPPKPCENQQALVDKNDHTPVSPQEKMLRLVLEVPKNILCKDVPVATRYLDITMKAIQLRKKIRLLKTVDAAQQFAITERIKGLIGHGNYDEAANLVGDAGFDGLRKELLIGLTVKMAMDVSKPKPKPKPKGLKELFHLDSMIRRSSM